MKTLILSNNNGGGHNSVAAAIREVYLAHGAEADIVDGMSFLPKGWSKIGSTFHVYMYRKVPQLSRWGFVRAEENRRQFEKGHSTRQLLDLGTARLGKFILAHSYDQVICSHVFSGIMLMDAVRKYHLPVATAIVETDYHITPGAEDCLLDLHFVPSEAQKKDLMTFGIAEDRIAVTGIPTRAQFEQPHTKTEARAALGLDAEKKCIIIACGSMGCGPMEDILEHLTQRQRREGVFSVCVLCGTNRELLEHLRRKYPEQTDIRIFENFEDMSLMLDAADVYITKPGGVSITEAAQKRLPMVFVDAVGGCELDNLHLFVRSGAAVTADTAEGLADRAVQLCKDVRMCSSMQHALESLYRPEGKEVLFSRMAEAQAAKAQKPGTDAPGESAETQIK